MGYQVCWGPACRSCRCRCQPRLQTLPQTTGRCASDATAVLLQYPVILSRPSQCLTDFATMKLFFKLSVGKQSRFIGNLTISPLVEQKSKNLHLAISAKGFSPRPTEKFLKVFWKIQSMSVLLSPRDSIRALQILTPFIIRIFLYWIRVLVFTVNYCSSNCVIFL